jgi:hypothetical protein
VFSCVLLLLALALIWICRLHGPPSIRHLFGQVPFETAADFLLLPAAVLGAVLLHEAGHLVASVALGFQMLGGSIGPLQIQILPGDWKATWSLRAIWTGSISAVPRSMEHWRGAMMTVISAGPLATLGSGLAAAALAPTDHAWAVFQIYFVQVSMLLFVLGLIPNSRQARRQNDARLLLDLLCRNQGAEEMELKVRLKLLVLAGERPQEFPCDLLKRLAAFRGRPESEVLFAQALSQWAMDSDEAELADLWDMRALATAEHCDRQIQNSVLASSGSFDVIFRDDPESARSKFGRVDFDALFPKCFAYRARAAQQIAWGRLHRAPALILRAQYAIPRGITHYALERTLLERLHMKALAGDSPKAKFTTASV